MIGIRQMMFMSHSYDHRVVDGSLGGMFLKNMFMITSKLGHEYRNLRVK